MKTLYTKSPIICKLQQQFFKIFSSETKPTQKHLFDILLSTLNLNGFQSVKFNFEHFIQENSDFKLKSYYYTLKESKIDLEQWQNQLISVALSIQEVQSKQPIILAVDDTIVEKFGESFEYCGKLYDHAAHDDRLYVNGHCFVSLMLSVPIRDGNNCRYISIPVAYRMWDKEETKLAMAAKLVRSAMKIIDNKQSVILCCDSWYPKAEVVDLVDEFENLDIICNVRSDTAMYELPSAPTGKRGRPQIRGKKLTPKDFELSAIADTPYSLGSRSVITKLFGKRVVYATVSKLTDSGCTRVFLFTKNPEELNFSVDFLESKSPARIYADKNRDFLPLAIYSLRWTIETAYYEQKTFWSLGIYMVRSKTGIETLINLLTVCYAEMSLLPLLDASFTKLKNVSPQQARFLLGTEITKQLFSGTLLDWATNEKLTDSLIQSLRNVLFCEKAS